MCLNFGMVCCVQTWIYSSRKLHLSLCDHVKLCFKEMPLELKCMTSVNWMVASKYITNRHFIVENLEQSVTDMVMWFIYVFLGLGDKGGPKWAQVWVLLFLSFFSCLITPWDYNPFPSFFNECTEIHLDMQYQYCATIIRHETRSERYRKCCICLRILDSTSQCSF